MSDSPTLPLRAENNAKFYGRFKWLALFAFGFGGYSLYDAAVAYPDQMARSEAFLEVAHDELPRDVFEELELGSKGHDDLYKKVKKRMADFPDFQETWEARATAEGWPPEPYEKLRGMGDIYYNYVMAGICSLGGAWLVLTLLRTSGRWFELNEQGVDSRWGESFSLDQITAIDKRQWRDKGIARLRYTDSNGRSRTFVVDNYKYHRKTTNRIMYRIENEIGLDKITGGRPDADPDAPPAEPEATPAPAAEQASSEA